MAGISTSISVQDSMTPVFRKLVNVMETVITRFERMEQSSHTAVDCAELAEARTSIVQINSAIDRVEASMNQVAANQRRINEAINAGKQAAMGMSNSIRISESSQRQFNNQIERGSQAASGLGGKIKGIIAPYMSLAAVKQGISQIGSFLKAADVQIAAERKLETVMHQRMSANEEMVKSVKGLLSEQQSLGVIGDEVAMAGAQQLATFLNTDQALKTLIPSMENLAAQQNGYNSTSGNMVSIGNMMGKAMQGQVGALQRAGITFSEAQAEIMKTGTEAEKAAMLADIITQNVGNMNAAMLATPGGQITNINNAWGDMREEIGFRLYPAVVSFFNAIRSNMPGIQSLMLHIAGGVSKVIDVASVGLEALGGVGRFVADNWGILKPVLQGVGLALSGVVLAMGTYKTVALAANAVTALTQGVQLAAASATAAFTGATAAQATANGILESTQWKLNGAILACPVFWIILAIVAVIVIISALIIKQNGLKVSVLTLGNMIATTWDRIKICTMIMVYGVIDAWNRLKISIMSLALIVVSKWEGIRLGIGMAVNGILNFIGDMKVRGLLMVEGFVNGAIDLINKFTSCVNDIAGTSFQLIDHISIGTNAAVHESALKSARNLAMEQERKDSAALLAGMEEKLDMAKAQAAQQQEESRKKLGAMLSKANEEEQARAKNIEAAVKERKEGKEGKGDIKDLLTFEQDAAGNLSDYDAAGGFGEDVAAGINQTAENTSRMAETMSLSDEDLRRMRESAERAYFDKKVEIQVSMTNNNSINSELDLDGIIGTLADGLEEKMAVMAEGAY